MAIVSQRTLAQNMLNQLRILDPSVSGELGTPERKIIDTLAQALSDAQVDLSVLESGLNLDTKYGDALDKFLSIFSFARQKGTAATGIVQFSRDSESTVDIVIPFDTSVAAITAEGQPRAIFTTTETATLIAGETEIFVPVRSISVGAYNNVAAETVTSFTGSPVLGITDVTNPTPTTGGSDIENDVELKARFKNTLFRNLAGTQDQYLALAVAGLFTNKANVVGPLSRYREYIQVPESDDSDFGNGSANEFTSALSTIPYSKYVHENLPTFVSNGNSGFNSLFYTEGLDFRVNTLVASKNKGDTYRQYVAGGFNPTTDEETFYQPNVTFLNVYTGDDEGVQLMRPGDIVLFEHSYLSSASRNDYDRGITNCVDVYTNGANPTQASTVIPTPDGASLGFIDDPTHRFHYDNYRRIGEPDHRPMVGNLFTSLFWNPLESLPASITVDGYLYEEGIHYWPVIDVSDVGGTVRARTGIEWSIDAKGYGSGGGVDAGAPTIAANGADSINVENYTFDKNVIDLQSALEGSKQVTTDVLVHKATLRYLKFDISIMYSPGGSLAVVNQSIRSAVQAFLTNTHFGSVIQLSDVLQTIHNVSGVDNVRWSYELDSTFDRVVETNANGVPRLGGIVDRQTGGQAAVQEIQRFYLTGEPTGGSYQIDYEGSVSNAIPYNATLSDLQAALVPLSATLTAPTGLNGSANGTPAHPFVLQFGSTGAKELVQITSSLRGGPTIFNEDFYLSDDELTSLPTDAVTGDSVAGLVLRKRAQNTW